MSIGERPPARGSVLIVTLWAVIFFAMMSVTLSVRAVSQARLITRIADQRQFESAMYSGIAFVQDLFLNMDEAGAGGSGKGGETAWNWSNLHMGHPELFSDIQLDDAGKSFSIGFDAGEWIYGLENEETKININEVSLNSLKEFYIHRGHYLEEDALALAEATIEWRERDAEFMEFGQTGLSGRGGFSSVDELLLVPRMTLEFWTRIEPYLTVYGSGKVNLNAASHDLLRALGLSESLVERLIDYRTQEVNAAKGAFAQKSYDADVFKSLGELTQKIGVSSEENAVLSNLGDLWSFESTTFRFKTFVTDVKGRRAGLECVMNRNGQLYLMRNI